MLICSPNWNTIRVNQHFANYFGLDEESVINDGQLRIHVLNASSETVLNQLNDDIDSANAEIESLKVKIEELQKDNSTRYAQISAIQNATKEEVSRIGHLIVFIKEVSET